MENSRQAPENEKIEIWDDAPRDRKAVTAFRVR